MGVIYLLTNQKKEGVLNYPVIKIEFLNPSFSFKNVDFLLFTSKNGVKGVDKLTNEWKKYPSFVIGEATANEVRKRGGKVEFIATSSYGDEFAKEINKKYKNKTFLFFRAKKLVSNIQKEFINNTLKEVIIYETKCNTPNTKLIKPSIVIFTSPSTVKCFAKVESFDNIISIAIGKKTKNELLNYTSNVYMPLIPSINECINIAKSFNFR